MAFEVSYLGDGTDNGRVRFLEETKIDIFQSTLKLGRRSSVLCVCGPVQLQSNAIRTPGESETVFRVDSIPQRWNSNALSTKTPPNKYLENVKLSGWLSTRQQNIRAPFSDDVTNCTPSPGPLENMYPPAVQMLTGSHHKLEPVWAERRGSM